MFQTPTVTSSFGNVGSSLTPTQVTHLTTAFGPNTATQLANGIRAAFSASSNSNNNSSGITASGTYSATADTAFGALYDRYLTDSFRFGKDKVATLIKDLGTGIVKFNIANMGQAIAKSLKSGTAQAITDMAQIDDMLIDTLKQKGMMIGQIGSDMQEELRDVLPLAQNLGVGPTKFLEGVQNLLSAQGKFITYSDETLSKATIAGRAFTEDSMDIMKNVDNFRNVGLGLADASRLVYQIGVSSLKTGLNAKETTKTVMANLDKLNQYGFKNGVEGLTKMVQQAQSLKVGMEATFKIAEKAFEPEGAIDLSARLQVIGGAMGDLNDPLRMMYDVTNNMEGLQTSLIGAASSLATFNTEQGRFEVTGANLRKAKAMADAFGITMGELTNMATKGAAKLEAMSELDMFPTLTDDQKEFASNLAQMKDGKIGIEVPKDMMKRMGLQDPFVELSSLTGMQIDQIKKMQEDIVTDPVEIAREQMNTATKMSNTLSAILLQISTLGFRSGVADTGRKNMKEMENELNPYGNPGKLKELLDKMGQSAAMDLQQAINAMGITPEQVNNGENQATQITNQVIEGTKSIKKDIIEDIKDVWKTFTGKVDVNLNINASNPDSTMLANAINRSPQIKSDLSDALSTGVRSYFANQS
jgi:hypothetical protein